MFAVQLLEKICNNTAPKESISIVLSSNSTDLSNTFTPPIVLDPSKKYEMALINLETCNSIPNIDLTNNTFVYSANAGNTWKSIVLPVGSYDIMQINAEIQRQMQAVGDWDKEDQQCYISLSENTATLKSVINILHQDYCVNFNKSTLRSILGFSRQILNEGYYESEFPISLLTINSILVQCNLISSSYLNCFQKPVIYSFFPDVPAGYKIVESPKNLVYLPVMINKIYSINVWFTDQDDNQLDICGQNVTLRLHIRSI